MTEKLHAAQRIFDDDYYGGSRVSFEGWDGLNEYEKLAAKTFEEGIENTLADNPPYMSVQPNKDLNDLVATFVLAGLGDGDSGPTWQFSVKENLDEHLSGCSDEDKVDTIQALLALVESIRALLPAELTHPN